MKKLSFPLLLISLVVWMVSMNQTVFATSYEMLEPEEVLERAEVIVMGKYDFARHAEGGNSVLTGFEFNVEKVYRGDVPDQIKAGIDLWDIPWAETWQNEKDGKFVLFLEKSKAADYLVPVVFQNGMVLIKDGQVEERMEDRRSFYQAFLYGKPFKTNVYIPLILGLLTFIAIFLYKRRIA